jgi:myo-inositol 2-dehydrogenase/D-chiro-inositol 1-dehydrogenase
MNRRKFIKDTGSLLGGIIIVPRHVLGKGYVPPSDKLTKAIIGVGGMGMNHIPS